MQRPTGGSKASAAKQLSAASSAPARRAKGKAGRPARDGGGDRCLWSAGKAGGHESTVARASPPTSAH
eukprot:3956441-Alexandrium_andersonii.AAC.1